MEVIKEGIEVDYAKYVGTADTRIMSGADWRAAGIDKQDTVVWNASNGHTLARDRFSDDAWAALALDPHIVFTGERPDASEVAQAEMNAARNRLMARQSGAVVMHAQDPVPAVDNPTVTKTTAGTEK